MEYMIRFPTCQMLQDLYEEACDCIMTGEYFNTENRVVSVNKANGIWRMACYDLGKFRY